MGHIIGYFVVAFAGASGASLGSLSVLWFARERVRKAEVIERPFEVLPIRHSDSGAQCAICHSQVHRYEMWDSNTVVCANCAQERIKDRSGNAVGRA